MLSSNLSTESRTQIIIHLCDAAPQGQLHKSSTKSYQTVSVSTATIVENCSLVKKRRRRKVLAPLVFFVRLCKMPSSNNENTLTQYQSQRERVPFPVATQKPEPPQPSLA